MNIVIKFTVRYLESILTTIGRNRTWLFLCLVAASCYTIYVYLSCTGSVYYKFNDDTNLVVDGYPRPILQDFGPRQNSTEVIPNNLDAVWFDSVSSLLYFFKGEWVRQVLIVCLAAQKTNCRK